MRIGGTSQRLWRKCSVRSTMPSARGKSCISACPTCPPGWCRARKPFRICAGWRSEEHTSELQSLMRISYAVFCLKKKKHTHYTNTTTPPPHHHTQRQRDSLSQDNMSTT